MPANKTQTSITGRLAVVYPTGHAARYYLIDSLGPIELIPVKEIGPLYRYDRVTITATGNLVSQENQRVLYMEEWAPLPSQQARFPTVSGPQSTLMILLQFSDMAGSHPVSYFQNMLTGSRGSMNAYYVEVSYNSITVTGTTTSQWYTLPHPSSYYNVNTWSSCAYGGDFDKLTQDIISLVDPYVNFAAYAHFLFVTADSYVWGCRLGGYFQTNEGPIYGLAYVNENYPLSTFCHEFGHDLGLPDLYDYSSTDPYSFIDGWDEMGYDNAQHFSSWSKIQLGWIQPSRITTFTGSTVTATISRIEYSTSGYLALKILTSSNIYYLVETRQKVGFDVNIPSNAPDHGVLITKIDESKGSGQGIVRLVDANPSTQSGFDGDAVWQVGQTYTDPTYRFQVSIQSWTGTGFTITVASSLSVATDRTIYAQGDSISYTGTGFTSDGAVRPCLSTDNDGSALCLIGAPNADGSGNIAGTMLVGTNIPTGPQKFWVYDVSSDRNSASVQLTITILQVTMTVSYAIIGGGTGYSAPTFNYVQYGLSKTKTLTTTAVGVSVDSGSTWSVTPNPLAGSTSIEQWIASQPTSGTASSSQIIVFTYQHQFYLTMQASPSGWGTVSSSSGWQNAGATVTIQAAPNPGYGFSSWTGIGTGSYTGTSNPSSVTINGPIAETANFLTGTSTTLVVSLPSISLGSSATLSGSVAPNPGSVPVMVSVSRDSGSTWAMLLLVMTDSSGSYSVNWTPPYPGNYLLKASWSGNSQFAGSASASASLTVTGSVSPTPTLLLSVPSTASRGQSITLSITVFNPTSSPLNGNVTVQITGPGNYVSFVVIQAQVAASSQVTTYYDWTIPSQAGTYTVNVGLLSTKPGGTDTGTVRPVTGTIQVT